MATYHKDDTTVKGLHAAIKENNAVEVNDYLTGSQEDILHLCVTELLPFGTALHHAAGVADEKIVGLILNTGIDVNIRQKESPITQDQTPLHIAALAGRATIADMLLSHGASIDVQESGGLTPLHCACSGNNLDTVQILLKHGASVNMSDYRHETPVQRSILRSSNLVIIHLIDSGADIHVLDQDGQTLLHYAVEWDNQEIVDLLLRKGININSQDNDGNTPLHLAESEEMRNMLLQHGADQSLRNKSGKPPIIDQLDMEREDLQNINRALERHLNISQTTRIQPSEEKVAAVQNILKDLVLPSVPDEDAASQGHSSLLAELLNKNKTNQN